MWNSDEEKRIRRLEMTQFVIVVMLFFITLIFLFGPGFIGAWWNSLSEGWKIAIFVVFGTAILSPLSFSLYSRFKSK